jgi:hypothetical protein
MLELSNIFRDDFIYLNFLDKWIVINATEIQKYSFKNSLTNIPISSDSFAVFVIKDDDENIGIALLSGLTLKKINSGIWKKSINKYDGFSPLVTPKKLRYRPYKKGLFLKSICSDSGFCLAFGQHSEKINNHFLGFLDFTYAKSPIKRIGDVSSNGFVYEITYERSGYNASSVLKSSFKKSSDNILFEYLVGEYINKQCLIFSCFVETYGVFYYKTHSDWEKMSSSTEIDKYTLIKSLEKVPVFEKTESLLAFACTKSKYLAILTQHIKKSKTLFEMIESEEFIENEILQVLYQIYMPLGILAETFTHYDLHAKNVIIYEPVVGKYINYQYYENEEHDSYFITFKSRYMAKIIDYGRSFFKDNSKHGITKSSSDIYDAVCCVKECDFIETDTERYGRMIKSRCGEKFGFYFASPDPDAEKYISSKHFISSSTCNISHDLRLLYDLKEIQDNYMLNMITERLTYRTEYGTPEIYEREGENDLNNIPIKINNVIDASSALEAVIYVSRDTNDKLYKDMESLGTLKIYRTGKPMEFIPAK